MASQNEISWSFQVGHQSFHVRMQTQGLQIPARTDCLLDMTILQGFPSISS